MSETKFTPGPWEIVPEAGGIGVRAKCGYICSLPNGRRHPGLEDRYEARIAECLANAALIAAAPELFALLKEALEDWDETNFDEEYPYRIDWADKARAALAKARGEK